MKKITFLALGLLLVIALAGCGKKNEVSQNNGGFRIPDFGQPERQTDIRGIVKSVVGNEVTILKIERPEGAGQVGDQKEVGGQTQATDEQKTQLSLGGNTNRSGGFRPGGGMQGRGQIDEETQTAMLEQVKKMSTGEETVTIPVGIQMLKRGDNDTGQPEMVEATLSDITENKMISVWLNPDVTDRKLAEFVMIMQ